MIDLAKQGDEETINSWITVSSLFVVLLFFETILLCMTGEGTSSCCFASACFPCNRPDRSE